MPERLGPLWDAPLSTLSQQSRCDDDSIHHAYVHHDSMYDGNVLQDGNKSGLACWPQLYDATVSTLPRLLRYDGDFRHGACAHVPQCDEAHLAQSGHQARLSSERI